MVVIFHLSLFIVQAMIRRTEEAVGFLEGFNLYGVNKFGGVRST